MGKSDVTQQVELIKKGTVDIILEEELKARLERSLKERKSLKVKLGIDATAPEIHLGFAVVLRKLRQFQDLGHQAVLIVGDFTGKIGDPSGQSRTRPQLTDEQIKANMATYEHQILAILRKDRTEFRYNSEWSDSLGASDVVRLASKETVARMLERDDFSQRYRDGQPISIHEFLYPIFMAYDSVAVEADIEIGGSDQRFNILVGRNLQKEFGQEPQVAVILPLLEGLDGVRKMSKSYDNFIGIGEPPREMFGKVMSIPDSLILRYFELATEYSDEELKRVEKALSDGATNPRDLKAELAREIVSMYHSKEEAESASEEFDRVFREKGLPDEVPKFELSWDDRKIWIVRLLTETGMVPSASEARRLVSQGGVTVEGVKVEDVDAEISLEQDLLLKVGKRRFLQVIPGRAKNEKKPKKPLTE